MSKEEITSNITVEFESILIGENEKYNMNNEINMDLIYEYIGDVDTR